jgi:two-component system, OmpR family, alkaline phosphatase synthesis response regulator PhoP
MAKTPSNPQCDEHSGTRRSIARFDGSFTRKILVVDDEPDVCELIRYNLSRAGFRVDAAGSAEEALELIENEVPHLLILDLLLPGMPGLELCRRIRSNDSTSSLPVMILSAKRSEADKVLGLCSGADDYMVKPFSPHELEARVKALLRRATILTRVEPRHIYQRGRLRIDFGSYEVFVDGIPCNFVFNDFKLLSFFVDHSARAYSREEIVEMVWGPGSLIKPRTIDVYVWRLRSRIELDFTKPEVILGVRRVGYRFNPDALTFNSIATTSSS